MNSESNIILCAGGINYTNLPISTSRSNAMVPVNGKPVIGWILDDLLAKGIHQAVVVLREENHRLAEFLRRVYGSRMELSLAHVSGEGSIVHSLQAGLDRVSSRGLVRIILGDTLIRDRYDAPFDFVYTGKVEEARRWCLVLISADGYVTDYIDKQDYAGPTKIALTGYYHLLDGDFLRQCVAETLENNEHELSFVLRRYGLRYPIRAIPVSEWFDFGHIDNLITARRSLLQSRCFNSLTIHPVLNTITKVSKHNQKLQDELDWYLSLPPELQVLTPRIITHRHVDGSLHLVQEYYGYPTLAELYVFGDVDAETWSSILRQVMRIHAEFLRYRGELAEQEILTMYWSKTLRRLNQLSNESPYWQEMLTRDSVIVNDQVLHGLPLLLSSIEREAQRLAASAHVTIIHGDFCFSNILFDVTSQIIRLIDPRGRFGRKGIYGDPRYDMAKLRHSISGLYDYIIADMFSLCEEEPAVFTARIINDDVSEVVTQEFDHMLALAGYNVSEIRFIEALLFLSMLPLHRDSLKHQQMMFLTGLKLFNEVFSCVS